MSEQQTNKATSDSGKKGRPTRTRKEAEAARQRPLVPADRKEAKRQARAKRDEMWAKQREALETGDERWLPERDKGKVRRYVRDYVDARWSLAEFLLPSMIIFLAGMLLIGFIKVPPEVGNTVIFGITGLFYGLLIASVVESIFVWKKIKKQVEEKYPREPIPKGTWFYTFSRMMMARRWRSPRPLIKRGEYPS